MRHDISELEDKREEFGFHSQRSAWTQLGDRCNVDFFKMVHTKFCNTGVKQLKKTDGILTIVPEEMRQVATDFFQDLLSAKALSSEVLECRQRFWDKVCPKVTSTMRQTLDAPLQEEELAEAIRTLPHTSCPGEDGLTPTFFQEY